MTLIFGIANLIRWIPELLSGGLGEGSTYFLFVAVDIVLGLVAVISGPGIRKGQPWAWEPTAMFWGAVSVGSGILLWRGLPGYLGVVFRGEATWEDLIVAPRLLYYVMAVIATPYAVWVLLFSRKLGPPTKTSLWIWLLVSGVAGASVPLALFLKK